MVNPMISRSFALTLASLALHAGCSSRTVDGHTGGETNWLATCSDGTGCTGGATCLCGVCTVACDADAACSTVAGSACAKKGSDAFAAACGTAAGAGVCLSACGTSGCKGATTCVGGVCVPAPLRAADGGQCQPVALATTLLPNCVVETCGERCAPCTDGAAPPLTGPTSAACTDNPCNPTCRRFADGATPVAPWPVFDGGGVANVVHQYAYTADCPSGTSAQMDFLTYGARTPGDSKIRITVSPLQTGETIDGGGPWRFPLPTVGSAFGDAPDQCTLQGPGAACPINLTTLLGDKATTGSLTLEVTLVPSGSDHPTLDWWEIRYSCVDPHYLKSCQYGGRTWANNGSLVPTGKMPGCAGVCVDSGMTTLVEDASGKCVECHAAADCAAGEYCDSTATCGTPSPGPGRCRTKPDSCTLAGNPVCGCDGKTYDTACLAARAGTGVAYESACGTPPPCWDGEIVTVPGRGACLCENGAPAHCAAGG
jgi:hypothetical protein